LSPRRQGIALRSISGGILAQETDWKPADRASMKVVSKAQPAEDDWQGMLFGWKVVRWVRSNAIVYSARDRTLGVGAGQMSRIDAARFGIQKAGGDVAGGYLASDAFFPFRDVVDLAAEAKIRAIIQPGGSVRDEESIAAADEHGIVMVFTGERHFRH
jgi:phosphoribosylaminoimidazolecarboxamide formyltransferase/IMP cyclohydrolase